MFRGNVDTAVGTVVRGWCCGPNGEQTNVQLRVDGKLQALFPAASPRADLVAANISDVGGFQFDIATFLPFGDMFHIEITDQNGHLLPKGTFTISGRNLARGHLDHILGDLRQVEVGVFGDSAYASELGRGSVLSKILNVLGVKIVKDAPGKDLNIWFTHPTWTKPQGVSMLNGGFKDAAKSAIDVGHQEVFGRRVCVSLGEVVATESYVVKSEEQAAHDGVIRLGADIRPEDFVGKVVQRVIDNRIDPHTVQDIRVPCIGGHIPFAYIKTRPITDRFSNGNRTAHVTAATNVLSLDELEQISRYCTALKIDYAELDVLRDAKRGDIWIVDVNNTPSGPPNGLSKGEVNLAVREMALTFFRRFLS